jgi:hypothetical protein
MVSNSLDWECKVSKIIGTEPITAIVLFH